MTLKAKVLYCLEYYPETRNSDPILTFRIWQNFTKKLIHSKKDDEYYLKVSDLSKIPSEADIRRLRAFIQNGKDGIFLPTDPEVIKARKQKEKVWRKILGYKTQEDHIKEYKQKKLI